MNRDFAEELNFALKLICVQGNVGLFMDMLYRREEIRNRVGLYIFEAYSIEDLDETKELTIFIKNCHAILSNTMKIKLYMEEKKTKNEDREMKRKLM